MWVGFHSNLLLQNSSLLRKGNKIVKRSMPFSIALGIDYSLRCKCIPFGGYGIKQKEK